MKKFGIQIVILLVIIFGALYLFYNSSLLAPFLPGNFPSPAVSQIKVGNVVIKVEIADTAAKRAQGLSGRDNLASDSGMLFVFPIVKQHQFWMKGMKFSLDFIFIRDGKVVDLMRKVPPPQPNQQDNTLTVYEPVVPIDMMLEVNSGFVDASNIKVGDQVLLVEN